MLIKTRGIVLRSVKYSETSIICDIFTELKGLRTYIISGVRSKNAKVKAGLLQLMSIVDIVAYHRDDKEMTRLKEVKLAHVYQSIPFEIKKGAIGLFLVELAQKTIREREENERLFQFLMNSFLFLDQTTHSVGNIHLHFMLELASFLGFMPSGEASGDTPFFDLKEGVFSAKPSHIHFLNEESSILMSFLLLTSQKDSHIIKMSRQNRKQLLHDLLMYYKFHLENFREMNAHLILEEVLN